MHVQDVALPVLLRARKRVDVLGPGRGQIGASLVQNLEHGRAGEGSVCDMLDPPSCYAAGVKRCTYCVPLASVSGRYAKTDRQKTCRALPKKYPNTPR